MLVNFLKNIPSFNTGRFYYNPPEKIYKKFTTTVLAIYPSTCHLGDQFK